MQARESIRKHADLDFSPMRTPEVESRKHASTRRTCFGTNLQAWCIFALSIDIRTSLYACVHIYQVSGYDSKRNRSLGDPDSSRPSERYSKRGMDASTRGDPTVQDLNFATIT